MTAFSRSRTFLLGTALLLSACGGPKPSSTGKPTLGTETVCNDGVDNDGDGHTDCDDLDCRIAGGTCDLAPPLQRSVATTVAQDAAFLYAGPDPLQRDAKSSAFDIRRIAMLRGSVVDRAGHALAGVHVSVVKHPEYGWTLTRPDGLFDLAVNGGGRLVLRYELNGYLPAERATQPGWQRYAHIPDVGMLEESATTSSISSGAQAVQVAVGDPVQDDLGERQPIAIFSAGTRATAKLDDGSEKSLPKLTLAITEYPFERSSLKHWTPTARFAPGTLPVSGGLHYGLEFSVEEAQKLGAQRVSLSEPVAIYVENFLKLRVGAPVPLGYYDRTTSQWQGGAGGLVVQILDIVDGAAVLDIDGDGKPEDQTALDKLGVTKDELQQLATRYQRGSTLWRANVSHFSPWDMLFPVGAPAGATAPNIQGLTSRPLDEPSRRGPSVVEPQALSQAVPIIGTPYSLHYESDRTSAYGPGFQLEIPLIQGDVPSNVKGVVSIVDIAGQHLEEFASPEPNLKRVVVWDGKDGFGRDVQGPATASVFVGFVSDGELEVGENFGTAGSDASSGDGTVPSDAVLSQQFEVPIGVWDAKGYGLGGFSVDVLHAYDPAHQTVFFGWGDKRSAENVALGVTQPGAGFDLGTPDSLAIAPDGSVLVTDDEEGKTGNVGRVLRIDNAGNTTVIAGVGAPGDGGHLGLSDPQGITVTGDGSILVADYIENAVRSIAPDGSVSTLVGDSSTHPVVEADLEALDGLAVGPRDEVYIVNGDKVLRLEASTLTTFAGGGDGDDGVPATEAKLVVPTGVVAAPDGSVYISEQSDPDSGGGNRVRRVNADGIITTVAGTGNGGFSGDGGSAQAAELDHPRGVALGPDGSLYIADHDNDRIRRVTPDGIIQTVVGGGDATLEQGQLAENVALKGPDGIAIDSTGALFIAASGAVFRVAAGLPAASADDALIPSTDGRTLYRFDHNGRHQATIDAMTGVSELTFGYDKEGLLTSIQDKNGLTTKFERDKQDNLRDIVAPFNQKTSVELDDNGVVRKVTDDLGRETAFEFDGELLKKTTDPNQGEHSFGFDDLGRLSTVTDPTGYTETLTPGVTASGTTVSVSTSLGRTTGYFLNAAPGNVQEREVHYPDGTIDTFNDAFFKLTSDQSDGSSLTTKLDPDNQFGAQALFPGEVTLTLPSGKTLTATGRRDKQLSGGDDNTVEQWTEHFEINGKAYESTYLAQDRTIVETTPEGRSSTTTLDELGRPTDIAKTGLAAIHLDYDDAGRVTARSTTADGETRVSQYSYGNDGLLAQLTDPASDSVKYTRDAVGRITSLLRPDQSSIDATFDANDNLLSLTPPGRDSHAFTYRPDNLVDSSTPPVIDGDAVDGFSVGENQYQYTDDGDLAHVLRSDGHNVDFTYDEKNGGRLKTLAFTGAKVSYGYDNFGVLTSASRSDGAKVTITHDGPLWTSSTWSGAIQGSVTASYDDDLRVSKLTVNDASSAKFTYDNDGLVTSATANKTSLALTRDPDTGFITATSLGVVSTIHGYSGFGELSELAAQVQSQSSFKQNFERDELGRITKITEHLGSKKTVTEYSYDELGRLVEVTRDGETTNYHYDKNGNRTKLETDGEELASGKYDGQDRIQSYGDITYEETAQGDLLRETYPDGALELSYDDLGNLKNATLSNKDESYSVDYVMDGLGRRVARRVNGEFDRAWLYQDALRPIAEIDSDGTFSQFIYTDAAESAPDFILRAGVPLRVVKDYLGSVRLVVNAQSGEIAQELEYDEFGNVTNDTAQGFQPFGFAGGLYDPDTHLVRFGARDYDSVTGRWMAKDPLGFGGGDTNLYTYCGGDPINLVDLDGREPKKKSFWEATIRDPIMCVLGNECTMLEAALYVGTMKAASTALTISLRLWRTAGIFASVESNLLKELAEKGVKHTPENIVGIAKNAAGKIVFLETGTAQAGLAHIIVRHGSEFVSAGIPESEIGNLVMAAATRGTQIGVQSGGRPIFEVAFMGDLRHVAVTISDNGYIVGANLAH
jgi:RHS repeat-associated protein